MTASAHTRTRSNAARVLQVIEELCASLDIGDRLPTHTELMRRFGASERAVLRALDELQRAGKIVRRNGVGTFVTDARLPGSSATPITGTDGRTVVAVAQPDQSFF